MYKANVGDVIRVLKEPGTQSAQGSQGHYFTVVKMGEMGRFYAVCFKDFNRQTKEKNTIGTFAVENKSLYVNYRTALFNEDGKYEKIYVSYAVRMFVID